MIVWMVALIYWTLLGTMEMCMPRELKMTPRIWLWTFEYRCTISCTFVVPNFVIPNFTCSQFPLPGIATCSMCFTKIDSHWGQRVNAECSKLGHHAKQAV